LPKFTKIPDNQYALFTLPSLEDLKAVD